MSDWTSVRITSAAEPTELISALFAVGATGVQEVDGALVTHIQRLDRAALTSAVRAVDDAATIDLAPTPDVDWTSEWKKRVRAHRVGPFVVCPPWLAQDFSEGERIVIEPAMAFGTGEHESTRGVLRLMVDAVRRDDRVADVGAGSAVLAIAAARLGAARAVALELDPDAIGNAELNVSVNRVVDRVRVVQGDASTLLQLLGPFDVILANIISSVLLELLPVFDTVLEPGGRLIVGGILAAERDEFIAASGRLGWRLDRDEVEGEWWSARMHR